LEQKSFSIDNQSNIRRRLSVLEDSKPIIKIEEEDH